MIDDDDEYRRSVEENQRQADVISAAQTQESYTAGMPSQARRDAAKIGNGTDLPKQQWDNGEISYHGFKDAEAQQKKARKR